jgi:hypothetical protein
MPVADYSVTTAPRGLAAPPPASWSPSMKSSTARAAESWQRARQFLTEAGLLGTARLQGCDIIPYDERAGRAAGVACAASATADVVDAIVIATAVRHHALVVTGNPATCPASPMPSASRSGSSQPDSAARTRRAPRCLCTATS